MLSKTLDFLKRLFNKGASASLPEYLVTAYDDKISLVEIVTGKFAGVKYRYGKVGFSEVGSGVKLSFTTEIYEHPPKFKNDELFTQVSGDILVAILEKNKEDIGDFFVG